MDGGANVPLSLASMNPVVGPRFIGFDRVYDSHEIAPLVARDEISLFESSLGPGIHKLQSAVRSKALHQSHAPMPSGAAETVVMEPRTVIDD